MMPTHRPAKPSHSDRKKTSSPSSMFAVGKVAARSACTSVAASASAPSAVMKERLYKVGLRGLGNYASRTGSRKELVDGRNARVSNVFTELVHVQPDVLAHDVFGHLGRVLANVLHHRAVVLASESEAVDDRAVQFARNAVVQIAPHQNRAERYRHAGLRLPPITEVDNLH